MQGKGMYRIRGSNVKENPGKGYGLISRRGAFDNEFRGEGPQG
jgi:hypothetical protein